MTVRKAAPQKAAPKKKAGSERLGLASGGSDLTTRLAVVEEKVNFLMKERPGRKYLPVVKSERGVCGVDPDRDSKTCGDASLWRRNNGCLGDACVAESTRYYKDYREKNRKNGAEPVQVKKPTRTRKKA